MGAATSVIEFSSTQVIGSGLRRPLRRGAHAEHVVVVGRVDERRGVLTRRCGSRTRSARSHGSSERLPVGATTTTPIARAARSWRGPRRRRGWRARCSRSGCPASSAPPRSRRRAPGARFSGVIGDSVLSAAVEPSGVVVDLDVEDLRARRDADRTAAVRSRLAGDQPGHRGAVVVDRVRLLCCPAPRCSAIVDPARRAATPESMTATVTPGAGLARAASRAAASAWSTPIS